MRNSSILATAIGLALASAAAQAQQAAAEAQQMPKVSVNTDTEDSYKAETASSPKFTQPLLDTPQTITVIKKELLQDQGAGTLAEALQNAPGITFTLGENGNTTTGDSVFMRGFDTSGSIFLDGIRDLGTISRDTFNVEQVEVVKGPSGSDNGRGSPTGYINMSSKVATLDDAMSSGAAIGTDNRMRLTSDMNKAFDIGLPGTAVRLNLMLDEGDKIGRDVAENKRWGVAPSLALGLGTSTRAHFNYLHIKQNNIPDGGLPAIGYPGYTVAGDKVDTENFYGSPNDFDHVKLDMFTAMLEHDITDNTTLRNTSRYGRTAEQYVLTGVNALTTAGAPDTWTVSRSRQGKDQLNEVLTNQTNLTSRFNTGSIGHSVSTGIEFIYERQKNLSFLASGTTTAANLYNPSTSDSFASVIPSGAVTDGDTTTVAVYMFDTLQFTPQWNLNAGIRFERYRTEYTSVPATPAASQTATLLNATDNLLTGKLGLVYKPLTNGSIYLAVASSQRPPGSSNFSLNAGTPNATTGAVNIDTPNLDPQKAINVELGTKWDLLDNRLVLTAAAFDTTNKNDQAISDQTTQEVTQYGEKKVRGFELGASGMITADWQVSAGIATLDTEVTEGQIGSTTQQGAQINFSPKFSFTSWTTYKLPFGVTVGGGARYVSSQTTQVNNGSAAITNLPEIPSYWVFDAMAGYALNEKLTFQLNVKNAADERYLASVNNGRSRYSLGAPRSALLTVNYTF